MMSSAPIGHDHIIASLAILMVNWEADTDRDYLAPFSEMLAEVIASGANNVIAVSSLQADYQSRFGLKLPAGVIKSLLRRLEKKKLIRQSNDVYVPDFKKLANRNYHDVRARVIRDYDSLIENLIHFCNSKFEVRLTRKDAETYLEGYLAEHHFELLNAMVSGLPVILPLQLTNDPQNKYMIASFVTHISKSQAEQFAYLETVLKGMMLVNVLYLPDSNKAIKRRWTTAFYFDTPFLIEALGYQGDTKRDLRRELVDALRSTGAKVRCFSHNVDEVSNILFKCCKIIESGNIGQAYGPLASSVDYIINEGFDLSDVYLEIATLHDVLEKLGFAVRDKPDYVPEHVIDEAQLETLIRDELGIESNSDRSKQVQNDVDSIASIYRMRKGKSYFKLEDCKAVFVTHNAGLLRASNKLFMERRNEITHCLSDFTLSNLLWLSRPDFLPDMPRKQIIADAYAATQPNSRLWQAYVLKIEQLKARRQIDADAFYAFRFTQEARNSLMEVTRGSREVLTDGTVREILEVVKSKFQKEQLDRASVQQAALQREADLRTAALSKQLEDSQQEKQRVIQERQRVEQNRRNRAQLWARRVFRIGRYLIFLLNILFFAASSPIHILSIDLNKFALTLQILLGIVWILLSIVTILDMRDGRSLRARIDDAESRFAKWIERKLTHITE